MAEMTGRFLITGLPRSRTAWFAVATGAMHEPISQMGYREFWPRWSACRDVGVSDAGAASHLHEIILSLAPRTLVIERPKGEVLISMRAYCRRVCIDWTKIDAYLDSSLAGLRYQHPLIKRVAFDDLASIETVRKCLAWLEVKEPANLEQLCHMNIQSDLRWNMDLLRLKVSAG